MKVKFNTSLFGLTGKGEGLIYYSSRQTGKIYARKRFKFRHHPAHPSFRTAQQSIYALKPSADYKNNLMLYLDEYNDLPENRDKQVFNWCHIFNKMMWNMQKAMPEKVNLQKITRELIESQNLPCKTVRDAVEAGLLPAVKNYRKYTKQI